MTDYQHDENAFFELPSNIVYVRELSPEETEALPQNAVGAARKVYAIHDANGERLALTDDRKLAFTLARQHDRTPVSVH